MKYMFIQKIIEKYFSVNIENKIGRKVFFWRVILINVLYWIIVLLISLIGLHFIFGDLLTGLLFLSLLVSTIGRLIYYSSLIFLFRKRTNDIGLHGNFSRNLIFIHFVFSILSSLLFIGYMEGVPGCMILSLESVFLFYVTLHELIFNGLNPNDPILLILISNSLSVLVGIVPYISGFIVLIQYIRMSLIKGKSE